MSRSSDGNRRRLGQRVIALPGADGRERRWQEPYAGTEITDDVIGQPVELRVDPQDPEQVVVAGRDDPAALFRRYMPVVGTAFIALGVLVALGALLG